ncbi:kinesin-like protein KIN-12F isoform X2 [Phragmites australis]|uniref:kinesin-like protein KIN-12F isoform X2 n=1 Tax=Phragmites australis TaxID=29695 RepID=UPI002D7797A1|nr:kinesin-like protein KIN-12F isoform X2 [Phragmites australis]
MVRDLGAVRRTAARASASEAGNDENAPGDASGAAAAVAVAVAATDPNAASRPPLLAIQPPASGLKRKPESPAPTPSKLPFRTPEKSAARSRFGWVPPRGEELPPRAGGCATPYSAMTTPRAHRGKAAAAVPAASESGSTQSTPTKSVTKPAYGVGMSGSRPPMSGGPRGSGFVLGFSAAGRGTPLSLGPGTVVNSAEVPHFELREDPSFWMENNVQVVIRVRPLNNTEKNMHSYNRCLKQESAQNITWIGQPETRFIFDHVACETVDQEVLFRVAGLPMVENCMAGYNSCVFAYGQTGSGKTYTMLGEINDLEVRPSLDRGMTPRIFEFLFARIRAEEESRRDENLKYCCKCSFLEIYNEQITDLLDPCSSNLPLREDTRKGVYVENLTEFEVGCVSDIIKLLMQGSVNRKVAATNMNRESSRSHSVFTCIIESRWEKDSTSNLRFARLNLVDLAGSERQRTSGAEGERLKEAVNINKSLSTLGLVIMSLVDLAHGKQRHVPYRDSRLTFLLQDSLGGNSKTMIIANVSPSTCSANETLSTLKFAQRARLIQNNAVVNEDASGDVLALQHQIRLLKEELAVLKRQHVTRSLSFTADIFERSGGDVDDGNDAQNRSSLQDLRISNKQLISLEEALAGALRRESVAENTVKQLEIEIEQLNRLVREREEDTRCARMMLKFRDEKIHRNDALVQGKLSAESYLLEENRTLSQEIELLRARVDKNPEVTRFALENIRLSNQLKRSQHFDNAGERGILLNEISELRNQVSQLLEGRIETENQNNFSTKFENIQWQRSTLACDAEILPMEVSSCPPEKHFKRTSEELETCRSELQVCVESNRKLTREIADLQKELSAIKISKEEHTNVFETFSSLNQYDSHAHAKMEDCSDEGFMKIENEDILNLKLELDILKTILAEERTARVEVEAKSAGLGDELKKNNQQSIELLKKRDMEISRLNNELDVYRRQEYYANEEPKMQLLKCLDNEDSPLQRKLKRMQASLEKARSSNARYQRDQASHCSAEKEMDEIRRQVEVETTEVIMCLQEELISLQQQLDASNKNDLLAKQSLDELQLEKKQLNDRLLEVLKENEIFSCLIEEKEKEIEQLTNDWDRLAADIGSYLVDGNAALDEASDQVSFISKSISQRKWVEDQVQKMCRGISERDELLEELQNRLKEADDIRCDLDLKLRSLRGAMQAVNEVHQQEKNDQEKEIYLLRLQVSEQGHVNNQQIEEIHRIELLLDESIETFVQKEVLEQIYVSLHRGMEVEIRHLESQLDQSKKYLAQLLSQTQDKEQAFERLKNEENTVLLRLMSDVLKAKGIIYQCGVGINTLQSSLSVGPEEVVCQNSDLNLEDRVDLKMPGVFQTVEQRNAEVLYQLSNETESAVQGLQMLQSKMANLLQEKENVKECHSQSQRTIVDLSAEVLKLNSDISDKESYYIAKLKELEMKMQEKDDEATASLISWSKEKEALEHEVSEAKDLAVQKSFEASTIIAKFEEAQATISDADATVKALVDANKNLKLQVERYKEKEASFIAEKNGMLSEINSLEMLLDVKEQSYELTVKKFQSSLLEANELALELEDDIRLLQNLLSEKLEFVSSDVEWMKTKLQQFAELARTWLEDNWLEIIGKDCAISVLHLCHMGILLERITGLNAENGFLQRGLCASNSLISKLREHNDKAKNELEMCSVLKGKLLLDVNHSFTRVAKKEQETTELNSRLDSFEKKILHLQAQEEAMMARSNSMYSELSVLIEEIDATNRSALAAESKEKEELRHQLDEALHLNGILKEKMLVELNLLQMNKSIPLNEIKGCNEFDLCNWLVDYRSDLVMTDTIAKDIESTVLALELKQHKLQLQKQRVMFTDVLEGLKAEATLWKVDQDLENIAIFTLSQENSEIRIDLENLKQNSDEAMENVHAMNKENTELKNLIASLESSIISFQTDLDVKNKALMVLECSHATIHRELELKTEAISIRIARENDLSSENETLKQKILDILSKEKRIVELVANIEADKLFVTIEGRFQLVTDYVQSYINEQRNIVSKLSNEFDIIKKSAEELSTRNSLLQSELIRKDELAKGLSFDLSLLQESASIAKDQAEELIELAKEKQSLEQALASKSLEFDDVVSDRQLLEAQILKNNEKVVTLEEELATKFDELNLISMENAELKSQLKHIEGISYTMEEELADKSEVTGRLEEELIELRSLINERNIYFQSLQNDFSKLSDEKQCCETQVVILKEKLEMAQALAEESEAIATESRQIAEERKAYAEEKDEEVKLLERSIEELESTVCALENKVGIIMEEAERQKMQREELEVELQKVREQMLAVPPSAKSWSFQEDGAVDLADSSRQPRDIHNELLSAQENIRILEKEVSEKESEIAQCKAHISEINIHADAAAREYMQKLMELEAMAQQVQTENYSANACSLRQEKISSKPRGSGSPFKCIGIGFVQQVNSEKDEELSAAKQRIVELEGIAASRQREIFMLNARLAATESMTHDVIRDMLSVKMNMTTCAALVDNQQQMETKEPVISQAHQSKESNELMKLKKQLDEFIEERQSWLDEMNQKQSELGAARITIEKLRQREHFMVAEVELLKAENSNYKTIILNLEDEVKKLTRQQNLQLRINHHVKTKEENILLKRQNDELSAKLQQLGAILARTKEELARYRVSDGKDPYEQIEQEELLRKKLDESEQDRSKLAENLSSLCTSILKVAGVRKPESDASLLKALECLNQLQYRIGSLESEVEDLKLKCKLLHEKTRLSELRSDSSSLCSGAKDGSASPSLCRSPSISSFP